MNRGVDKRPIALSDKDRLRFVKNLLVLNDSQATENFGYLQSQNIEFIRPKRKRLVTIHAWCLMGNHYHLLISESVENGISEFLKKLNGGYSRFFNKKHNRSGALFQGKTKRVLIENDRQFLYILPYIHLNPLDFVPGAQEWRSCRVTNRTWALRQVTDYRWSSLRNYCGENEFADILDGSELFADRNVHAAELKRYLISDPDAALHTLNLE